MGAVLFTPEELSEYLKNITEKEIYVDADSKLFAQFKEKNGNYPLFSNQFFASFVYAPIKDAVEEVTNLSTENGGYIETVIFSGRSCLFPIVKETVIEVVGKIKSTDPKGEKDGNGNIKPKIIDTLGSKELKTAVVIGACYYGMYKDVIQIKPYKVNCTFGVKKSMSANKETDFKFIELIKIGEEYENGLDDNLKIYGEKDLSDKFLLDGNNVNFYQIMGRNSYDILREKQKHKYSKIASLNIPMRSKLIGAEVSNTDKVECYVTIANGEELSSIGLEVSQEIAHENEEHYTWIVE